jgi:hypothetical protein
MVGPSDVRPPGNSIQRAILRWDTATPAAWSDGRLAPRLTDVDNRLWFPEPLLTDPYQDPKRSAELADSVSMAALLLLERLSPLEWAIFVPQEVFGFDVAEIASAVRGRRWPARQLAVRPHWGRGAMGAEKCGSPSAQH